MKSNQTLKIPFYIVLSVKLLNFFSENLAVKYAAFLFSIPIKFRRPEREKDYYLKSSKRRILIPEIDKKLMLQSNLKTKRYIDYSLEDWNKLLLNFNPTINYSAWFLNYVEILD